MTNGILKTNDGIKILMSNIIKRGEKAKIINGYVTMIFQKVIKKFFENDALEQGIPIQMRHLFLAERFVL